MSRSRRRGQVATTAPIDESDVPMPLRSRFDAMWREPAAVLAFIERHGLALGSSLGPAAIHHGPLPAFEAVARAWIEQHGPSPAIPWFRVGNDAARRHGMAPPLTEQERDDIAEQEHQWRANHG